MFTFNGIAIASQFLRIFLQLNVIAIVWEEITVQLKGNLTHADRVHAIYWLKACSFVNPY